MFPEKYRSLLRHPVLMLSMLLVFIILINNLINNAIKDNAGEENPVPVMTITATPNDTKTKASESAALTLPNQKNKLIPADPAQFGIVVQAKAELPRNQTQWDEFLTKTIKDSKVLELPEAKPALEFTKMTREDFDKKMQETEASIAELEAKTQSDPSDEFSQKRLQSLYELKALAKIMEDKVIIAE